MHLQLGQSGPLINGCPNWGCAFQRAMGEWNFYLNRSQLVPVPDSTAPIEDGNLINNVFYSSTIFGDRFDSSTLAITLQTFVGTRMVEADMIFNNAFSWNAYDGPLRRTSAGTQTLQDFQRVALHELGHVLGLGHPDERGQSVLAVMNSRISDLDTLQYRRHRRRLRHLSRNDLRHQSAVPAEKRDARLPQPSSSPCIATICAARSVRPLPIPRAASSGRRSSCATA